MTVKERLKKYHFNKIAIYGIGTESEKVIQDLDPGCQILGLLDSFKKSGSLYGKPILDLNECRNDAIDAIVVVARPGSCKAIAKNIGDFCVHNGIALIDVRGKNLLEDDRIYYNYGQMAGQLHVCMDEEKRVTDSINVCAEQLRIRLFMERLSKNCLEDGKGEETVCIRDAYDIGYLFCAPLITDFVFWIRQMVESQGLSHILFCGRDGYLLKQLYQMIDPVTACSYFLTSRMAAIRSGVENEADLDYVDSMKFSGSLEQNMLERFGIDVRFCEADYPEKTGILKYKEKILAQADRQRKAYRAYLEELGCREGRVAFVDFVAKGTTQYFVGKLFPGHLTGLYFLQLEPQFMENKNLDIHPFFSNEELESSSLFDSYYIMETILTSPEPSMVGFDANGAPMYAPETRTQQNIECVERMQKGIVDYFGRYIEQCDKQRVVYKGLDDRILEMIHHVRISDQSFLDLTVEDPFFNRMTSITDVL